MIRKILLILSFLFIFTLASCDTSKLESRNLRSEINEMIEKYPDRVDELEALKKDLYANPSRVYLIAKRIKTLKAIYDGIYDGFISVKIIDLTNEVIKDDEILYRFNEQLWDVLLRNYEVIVDDNEEDHLIKSIGASFIDHNYQLKYYLNGIQLNNLLISNYQYGDSLTIRNENISRFEQIDLQVDQAIYKFIRHHLYYYFTKTPALDPFVVRSVKALEQAGYNINLKEVASKIRYEEHYQRKIYDTKSNTYVNNLLKDIMIMSAFELDLTSQINNLNIIINNLTTLQKVNALLSFGTINTPMEEVNSLLDVVNRFEPNDNDVDNVSLALKALANYPHYSNYLQNVNRFSNYLAQRITSEGIGFNGANCLSTSNAIIALTSNNINPRGNIFKSGGNDLVEALLKYEVDGAFSWTYDSGIDLSFSTPQGWAALVSYKLFHEKGLTI